MGSKNSRH